MKFNKKGKILVIYAIGEFPTRKTTWSLLYSFKKYTAVNVYYLNAAFGYIPWHLRLIDFDLVVFTPFVTTPWNKVRYYARLEKFKAHFSKFRMVAFFQDEFFNLDASNRFISELKIPVVYSVAPSSEWKKLYGNNPQVTVRQYLTGYLDSDDIKASLKKERHLQPKDIDVGYRTGLYSKGMYSLGRFGKLKFEIAEKFLNYQNQCKMDIAIGKNFLNGQAWFDFLERCRYTIGVESGASLLDYNGDIDKCIKKFLSENKNATYEMTEKNCFPGLDGNLELKALSPRIFEAALAQTGLILVEGEYNGVVRPHEHYLPLKKDFSNLDTIIQKIPDEEMRQKMVNRVYNDVVLSGKYTYEGFIQEFMGHYPEDCFKKNNILHQLLLVKNSLFDQFTWFLAFLYCKVVKKYF